MMLVKVLIWEKKIVCTIDSYFQSVLYYNASIWLTPELSATCKHDLLSVSSYALRTCFANNAYDISFVNLHKHNKKCTPNQIMMYLLSLNLYASLSKNFTVPSNQMVRLLDQIICTSRQTMFELRKANNTKIGKNMKENKFYPLNKLILMDNLSWSFARFKKQMKINFLTQSKMQTIITRRDM